MKFKYDKREQRIFRTCGIVFTVLLAAAFFAARLFDSAADINTIGIIAALLLQFLPIPAFACWIGYIDSTVYIKKLEAGGIKVPEDKRLEPVMEAPPVYDNEQDSRESLALAVICFVIAGMLLIHILAYYFHWNVRVGSECGVMVFAQAVVMILWCIGGFVYLHQRSAKYYRDDTVFDPGRKVRTGLLKGILTIIIMLAVTAAACAVARSMTRYMYRTRLHDKYGEQWREHDGEPALPGEVYR
ncbi:MAG: hypothetical protein IKR23_07180 [Lachnospiraceae bacterium]|nr:hypothetical protein [Lachnospiraceae bacterium]